MHDPAVAEDCCITDYDAGECDFDSAAFEGERAEVIGFAFDDFVAYTFCCAAEVPVWCC